MGGPSVQVSLLSFLLPFVHIVLLFLGVYCLILFIRLAHRGIKALDIYIRNNSQDRQLE